MNQPAHSLDIRQLYKIAGATVLVTGGASGVGLMFTTAFVQNGAIVYISSRNAKECEKVAAELTKKGPGTFLVSPPLCCFYSHRSLVGSFSCLGIC